MRATHWLAVRVVAVLFLAVAPAAAQLNRATISGTVTDPTTAAIPGVSVTITGEGGIVQTAVTNGAGQYTLPSLPVGTYTVKFELTGFKTYVRENVKLEVSQTLRVDAQFSVGQLSETVSVEGTPQIIQRETPEVGTTVTRDYLNALPLSMGGGRYAETFAYKLSAGVEGDTWTSRINGSPAFSKEVLLEGASVTTYLSGHFGESSVSMEALQEFKIQTSGLSAEYGRTAGGVFNFVMRSGQNRPHGTGFETFRNEALNANTFLNNAANRPKSRDRQNNYGGSFGGPVLITSRDPEFGPLWSIHGAWLDFDRDGWLDLFIVNYCRWDPASEPVCGPGSGLRTYCHPDRYGPLPNQLFRNNRGGTFQDVSARAGIASHRGKGMGAAVGDIDGDGWPDVFVANDAEPNVLFRNRSNGTFEEVADGWGVAVNQFGSPVLAMGADLRDVDNDGRLDLFVTDLSNEGFLLFRNAGAHFDDASDSGRITMPTLPYSGWSNPVEDYNNDGWKDLFSANGHVIDNIEMLQSRTYRQRNTLLLNNGDGTFSDVTSDAGRDLSRVAAHRGAAAVDFDNDGRMDLVVTALGDRPKLLRNVTEPQARWITLRLVGRTSNRDGLGASVRLTLDDGSVLVNHATTSVGFASSADPRVHFGLGRDGQIKRIELVWPSGIRQTIERPTINAVLTIEEH